MDASGLKYQNVEAIAPSTDLPSAGEKLARTRLASGIELCDLAQELKISESYLQAIEQMDMRALPTMAYAKGFVRCYAMQLGLDGDTLVKQFCKDMGTASASPRPVGLREVPFWADIQLPKRFGLAVAVGGMLVLASWYGYRSDNGLRIVPPVPEALASWSSNEKLAPIPAIHSDASRQTAAVQPRITAVD